MKKQPEFDMVTYVVRRELRRFQEFYGRNTNLMPRLLTGRDENGNQIDAPRTFITPNQLAQVRLGKLGTPEDRSEYRAKYVDTAVAVIPNPSGPEVKYVLNHPLIATLTKNTPSVQGALPVSQEDYDNHYGFTLTGEQADAFIEDSYANPTLRRELFQFVFEDDGDLTREYEQDVTANIGHPFNAAMGVCLSDNKGLRLLGVGSVDDDDRSDAYGNYDLDYDYGRLVGVVAPEALASEALALLQMHEAPQKVDGNMPPLDTLVASLGRVIAPANEAEVRRILSAFYQKQ